MATVANLAVSFTARTRKFNRSMRRMERRMRSTRRAIVKLSSVAGIVAGGGFGLLTAAAFKTVDAHGKVSDKLGATTEGLMALQFAARQAGIETRTFNMASQRLVRRLSEAAADTGEAKDALKQLGINAKALNQQPLAQKMLTVAGALSKVKNQGDKVRMAFKLFDSEGVAMVNLMQQGEEAMRAAMQEAEDLGIVLSRIDAAKVEIANDEFAKMREFINAIFNQVAVQLAPAVLGIAKLFTRWAKEGGGAAVIVENAMENVKHAISRTVDVFRTLKAAVFGVASIWGKFAASVLRFADFAASGGIAGMVIRKAFGIEGFDPLKSATGIDLRGIADSVEFAAKEAWDKAADIMGRVGSTESGSMVNRIFSGLGEDIDDAVRKKLAAPGALEPLKKLDKKQRAAQFKQINLRRTGFGAPGGGKENMVHDPQLEMTNELLRQIARKVGGGSDAVFS